MEEQIQEVKIGWKEIKERINLEKTFLDTIDLLPYLKKDKDILDAMDEIEADYGEGAIYKEEPYLFNYMNCDEFIEYLRKRYPNFRYYEHTEYRVAHI